MTTTTPPPTKGFKHSSKGFEHPSSSTEIMSLQVLSMLNFIFLNSSSGGPDLGDPSYS
jgi:hypothetical protein